MGENEKHFLQILDEIGIKMQAYQGNVFIGNHHKVIKIKIKSTILKTFTVFCVTN